MNEKKTEVIIILTFCSAWYNLNNLISIKFEDEDYDEERSGPEDDAPESFQSISGGLSQWTAVPDLVRVDKTSLSNTEDDSPEGVSFLNHSNSSHSDTSREDSFKETGAIPKNSRILAPPDISQTGPSNSSSNLTFPKVNKSKDPSIISLANRQISGGMRLNSNARIKMDKSINNLYLQKTLSQPIDTVKEPQSFKNADNSNLEFTSLLPSSFSSSHQAASSSSSSSSQSLHSLSAYLNNSSQLELNLITKALKNIQLSVENLSKQLNERLTNLEKRMEDLTQDLQMSRSNSNQASIDRCQLLLDHQRLVRIFFVSSYKQFKLINFS